MGGDDVGSVTPGRSPAAFPVLLVEPSGFYAAHMESLLSAQGGQCDHVKTAAEAKASIARGEYELICVSRRLEDSTGPQLARYVRKQAGLGRVPLFMLTADESQEIYEEAYAAGVTEVFFRGELERLANYLAFIARSRGADRRLIGRVLYLEDTKWLAAVTIGVLHNLGLAVDHFVSVAPALEAFSKNSYDLVITDIILEGAQSGVSLVRAIRTMSGRRATIPILAVTGIEDASRRIELFRAGVSDYVVKPVISEELVARVSNLVVNKQLLETVQQQQEQLQRLATVDVLTGLYNRRHLSTMAGAAMAEARANDSDMSILMLDLDGFKTFNDTYGHQAGDSVLVGVGEVLGALADEFAGSASRFGGEEFLVLLSGFALDTAAEVAEELRRRVEAAQPGGFPVTISIGVAQLGESDTFESLVERADGALYRAKAEGRNRVCHGLPVAA